MRKPPTEHPLGLANLSSLAAYSARDKGEDSRTLQQAKILALQLQLRTTEKHHTQQIALIKAEHASAVEVLKHQGNQWRASNEDEFCRLLTCCTQQLTAMQERYERVLSQKAFLGQELRALKAENERLRRRTPPQLGTE